MYRNLIRLVAGRERLTSHSISLNRSVFLKFAPLPVYSATVQRTRTAKRCVGPLPKQWISRHQLFVTVNTSGIIRIDIIKRHLQV